MTEHMITTVISLKTVIDSPSLYIPPPPLFLALSLTIRCQGNALCRAPSPPWRSQGTSSRITRLSSVRYRYQILVQTWARTSPDSRENQFLEPPVILLKRRCVRSSLRLLACFRASERGGARKLEGELILFAPDDVRRTPLCSDSIVNASFPGILKSSAMRGRRWTPKTITNA